MEGPITNARGAEGLWDCEAASEVSGVVGKRGDKVGVEAVGLTWELEVSSS